MVWVLNFSLKFLLIVFFIAAPTQAAEDSRVFVPNPPKGKGENCVRDTVFMRANHMNLLMHQRDKTVLEGIRTKQYSLKECVACHAVLDSNGQPVSYQTPKHFCRSCHDYAAVKIDCFECHASAHSGDSSVLDFQAGFIFTTLDKAFSCGRLNYRRKLFGEDLDD